MLENANTDINLKYRNLVMIWLAVVVFQLLLFGLTYLVKTEIFRFEFQQDFLDDIWIIVILAVIFGLEGLIFSFITPVRYLKRSIADQNPELVQTALIMAIAKSSSTFLWGVFLAFGFDYQYFFLWMVAGFLVTILHFPLRSNLQKASEGKSVVL